MLDLARHFFGPQGLGTHHSSQVGTSGDGRPAHDRADWTNEPGRLAQWTELHEAVDQLPADERAVLDLLFYQGLSQAEAAELLVSVSARCICRWQAALVELHDVLKHGWPE